MNSFLFLFVFCFLVCVGADASAGSGAGSPQTQEKIKHFIVVMMENRAFDHLLGHLKFSNPEIDGLTGKEYNLAQPSDPNSKKYFVSFDCPYDINMNPGHSIQATEIELWGSNKRVDPARMNGFISELMPEYTADEAAKVMKCYNSTSLSILSTLAMEYAVFDRWYSSLPGPTFPNRMYSLSGTSHGSIDNNVDNFIKGSPQRTLFDDIYDSDKSFRIYYSDFPVCIMLDRLRKYPTHFSLLEEFFSDVASGDLPDYSWVEPRWFSFLEWPENDEHPHVLSEIENGNILYGEFFLKEIYEAVRASPIWNETALIITYDEHGGLYDHVPPPQNNVPNPDGINSTIFNFDRLGVRIPTIVVSPWVEKGSVVHEPPVNHFDHTSVIGTLRKMLPLKQPPLTKREAWSGTFEKIFETRNTPRDDCLETLPVPPNTETEWNKYITVQRTPETPQTIETMLQNNPNLISNSPRLTDLQQDILGIAHNLIPTETELEDINTMHEGAIFVRKQMSEFFKNKGK